MNNSLFALLLVAACQPSTDATHRPPTDLTIVNPIWTRSDPHHLYDEVEVCEHDFTIRNTSDTFTYNRIIVKLSYFDKQHRLLQAQLSKITHPVKPHGAYRVRGLNGGNVKPGTESARVELVEATRERHPVFN